MIMIGNFLFSFINVCVIISFLTKLLTLGDLFSSLVTAVAVATLAILSISPLTSFILALWEALVAKLVRSGILNWIGAFTLSLLLKLFPRKLEP